MLKNAECAAIIQVIGAGSGGAFDLDAARYQRVIFMADADVDGAHIRCLLLTLFHRYMRPMVEAGRVFAAVPPLHRIELLSPKKNQPEYVYTYSDAELHRTLLELERKGQRWEEPPQRYKGLGEMDAVQLAETTMDPRHRTLRRIRIGDAAAASGIFDLLMGSEVASPPRLHRQRRHRARPQPDRHLRPPPTLAWPWPVRRWWLAREAHAQVTAGRVEWVLCCEGPVRFCSPGGGGQGAERGRRILIKDWPLDGRTPGG